MNESTQSSLVQWLPRLAEQPYWHPDQIRNHPAPDGLRHDQWLPLLKCLRLSVLRELPFADAEGRVFRVAATTEMQRALHALDTASQGLSSDTVLGRERLAACATVAMEEEALASVALSSAGWSHPQMVAVLRQGQPASTDPEKRAVRLHKILRRLPDLAARPITPSALAALNRQLVGGDSTVEEGPLRQPDGKTERMAQLCDFAEGRSVTSTFLHPLVRAVAAAFWLDLDRPFEHGNGRTARCLIYWVALRCGYPVVETLALSAAMLAAKHSLTHLKDQVLTDEADLTYYMLPWIKAMEYALAAAKEHLVKDEAELSASRHHWNLNGVLNPRQEDIVLRALSSPDMLFTIEDHRAAHDLAYATARADLLRLEQLGLMVKLQRGKSFCFRTAEDWMIKLKRLSDA
jgi:hypothetical protein